MDDNARLAEPRSADDVLREALVVSALASAAQAERIGLAADRIVISAKVSRVQDLIAVYRELARRSRYALHLGLTEAGLGAKGIVATTAALAVLLQDGIGDTIRASLTPRPGEARTQEVIVCQELLQSLGLRSFAPQVTACPGCGRTTSTYFQELADRIQGYLRDQMPVWKQRYPGVEALNVAVMGCIVNGPGESKHADLGISLPGTGESPAAPVFIDGKKALTLRGERIAEEFQALVESYVERRYGAASREAKRLSGPRQGGSGAAPLEQPSSGRPARATSARSRCSCRGSRTRSTGSCSRANRPGTRAIGVPSLLVEIDGRVIGVMVTGDDWIEDLWVAAEWRHRGVGSRLLAAGERQIAARGHALGHLRVIAENLGARRFYARHGWSEVERYPHERWGFAMIDLSKPLTPAEPEG